MYKYKYNYNKRKYELCDEGSNEVIVTHEQIAFCYDSKDYVLFRHGSVDRVKKYYEYMRNKLYSSGLIDMAKDLEVLILPNGFSVEEINKCLNICDYIGKLATKVKNDKTV